MILKKNREILNLSLSEFKIRFAKEIETAFGSYMRAEQAKPHFRIKNTDKSDFYFNLHWNFNHHACSDWYIEKF